MIPTPCAHLLQMQQEDGTLTCLVCDADVTAGAPVRAVPGLGHILDDPLVDYIINNAPQ